MCNEESEVLNLPEPGRMLSDVGLVLEGGGMRGVFSAGVLDYFLDNGMDFGYIAGVSAGACCACNFLARQRGRMKKCLIDFYEQYHFISFRKLITKRTLFDFDIVIDKFGNEVLPFDYDIFFANSGRLEIVASNCLNGQAVYLKENADKERLSNICKASSSLPIIMPKRLVDGIPMLDGGICDPIPIERSISLGYKKNVIVLTRNKGHLSPFTNLPIPQGIFGREITEKMRHRGRDYNNQMDLIESLALRGEALVIRPVKKLRVSVIERDLNLLRDLYDEGYECAAAINDFIK